MLFIGRGTLEGLLKKNDVGCSSFKTIWYGINVTCKCLQNNLALMGHKLFGLPSIHQPEKEDKRGFTKQGRRHMRTDRGADRSCQI
jgi:hypothetical protein